MGKPVTSFVILLLLLAVCQLLASGTGSISTSTPAKVPAKQQFQHRPQCNGALEGIAVVAVAVTDNLRAHNHDKQQHVVQWMSVANKRAYAATRNYTLYVSSVKLQHAKSMVWDKFIIIKAVMQHSCAEWVWMLDADAFIMNLDIDLKKVITAAVEQHNSTTLPDVIIAKDCNGMNAGSFLVRNTLWTWQHLSDAWAANNASEIDRFEGWQEQAALSHMVRNISGVADHYAFAPQLSINAYSAATGCNVERPYQVSTQATSTLPCRGSTQSRDVSWLTC